MSSLNSALNIAKTALLSTEKAIGVTSHNIANANTDGYTRQRVVFEDAGSTNYGGLEFGNGVNVVEIERIYDSFVTVQGRTSSSLLSRYETADRLIKSLESSFNDLTSGGLSGQMDKFFNAFHDLANNPASYAERSTLISTAEVLADTFASIDTAIRQGLSDINNEIEQTVDRVNSLASQIAGLNNQISVSEASGAAANDLRDRRDNLLQDLSKLINISTYENSSGMVDVYAANGSYLVAGVEVSNLSLSLNAETPAGYNVLSNGTAINRTMTGGSLKGLLDGDGHFRDALDSINVLAAAIVKEVNIVHSSGYGLDGSTGVDFFSPLSVTGSARAGNTGGGAVTAASVANLSLVTLDRYEIRFSGPAAYTVVNTATNSVVTSGAYTSGSAITFDGLSVTISDDTGAPASGDVFSLGVTAGAARDMAVSIQDPDKLAASGTLAGIPGDNTNALALAALKDSDTIDGAAFAEYYRAIVTDIGLEADKISTGMKAEEKIYEAIKNSRDSISGVSLEEEAIELIKLQRAYEAAAKVLSTVDQMLETLLNIR